MTTPATAAPIETVDQPASKAMIGPRAIIVLEQLEDEARRLRKMLKRNLEAQAHMAVIVGLTR